MVSGTLVALVAILSNMIYSMGSFFIVAVQGAVILTAGLGAWLIYRIAPFDPIVHRLKNKS